MEANIIRIVCHIIQKKEKRNVNKKLSMYFLKFTDKIVSCFNSYKPFPN